MEGFRPFGMTDDEYEELLVLRDGVPPELREPLLAWIFQSVTDAWQFSAGRYLRASAADTIRSMTKIDLGQRATKTVDGPEVLQRIRALDDAMLLRLTDAILYLWEGQVPTVAHYFDLSSSKYMVDHDGSNWRVLERLPAGTQDQIEHVIASGGAAGALLHRAFTAAYGLQVNPGEAYKMSVKAVETAAHSTIEPKNSGATLGTMLAVMRNAPKPWTLQLDERADHVGGNAGLLISVMQSLWDGQEDRHRDGVVDIGEARTAFHAASTLVAWFTEGLVS
jgi:hypothetical protein